MDYSDVYEIMIEELNTNLPQTITIPNLSRQQDRNRNYTHSVNIGVEIENTQLRGSDAVWVEPRLEPRTVEEQNVANTRIAGTYVVHVYIPAGIGALAGWKLVDMCRDTLQNKAFTKNNTKIRTLAGVAEALEENDDFAEIVVDIDFVSS